MSNNDLNRLRDSKNVECGVLAEVVERIYGLFPSSKPAAVLVMLGREAVLPYSREERFSYMTIVSELCQNGDRFLRSCDVRFSTGRERKNLCDVSLSIHISPSHEVFQIAEKTKGFFEGRASTEYQNYFKDPDITDPLQFGLALQRLEDVLTASAGAQAVELSLKDPLIWEPIKAIHIAREKLSGHDSGLEI